jgi:DNA-binding NarL/FixJ family response regulator
MTTKESRTALLVDRHPLWCEAVERLLNGVGFAVAAKLDSARAAVGVVSSELDLVITDVATADAPTGGLDVLAAAREAGVSAIVLSGDDRDESIKAAFEAGAAHTFAARQTFSRSIYTSVPTTEARPAAAAENPLTPREHEVVGLAARGRSNGEIATLLQITEQTVKLHLANSYRKLGVTNRTQAGRRALELGLIDSSSSAEVDLHLSSSGGFRMAHQPSQTQD